MLPPQPHTTTTIAYHCEARLDATPPYWLYYLLSVRLRGMEFASHGRLHENVKIEAPRKKEKGEKMVRGKVENWGERKGKKEKNEKKNASNPRTSSKKVDSMTSLPQGCCMSS
jgi:hypothetical protein